MEMDTFRGVLILHFLSMITPQYHHIFFILWNSLSFSSEIVNTYRIVSRKALCNSPNFRLIEKLHFWRVHRLIAGAKVCPFSKIHFQFTQVMKQSTSLTAKPAVI